MSSLSIRERIRGVLISRPLPVVARAHREHRDDRDVCFFQREKTDKTLSLYRGMWGMTVLTKNNLMLEVK